jgi:hypothetical protein
MGKVGPFPWASLEGYGLFTESGTCRDCRVIYGCSGVGCTCTIMNISISGIKGRKTTAAIIIHIYL